MSLATPPDPTAQSVARDLERLRYAVYGAAALLAGIWLVWFGGWRLGWANDALGILPRDPAHLVGILSAPLVHASFEHLMANTLPLGLLGLLVLYAYPLAARRALPAIWLGAGLGVWLFGRASVHVGISGITHGLMFFLFLTGLLRRDRLGVVIALVVFFFYGGMLMTVLPREEHVSFEYHLAGAVCGVLAALRWHGLDPLPPRKHYSWEYEDDAEPDSETELPRPDEVPVLWQRPAEDVRGRVIEFRPRPPQDGGSA